MADASALMERYGINAKNISLILFYFLLSSNTSLSLSLFEPRYQPCRVVYHAILLTSYVIRISII